MDMVCIEYELSEKDFINAIERDSKDKGHNNSIIIITGTLATTFLLPMVIVLFWFFNYVIALIFIGLSILAILFSVLYLSRAQAYLTVRGRLRRGEIDPQYFGRHRLELKEDCLELQYGTICVQRHFATIQKVVGNPKCTLIYDTPVSIIIVPHTAFVNAQHHGDFFNFLQFKISQAKNTDVLAQSINKNREPSNYVVEVSWDEESFISALTKASRLRFTTRLGWSAGQIICALVGIVLLYQGISLLTSYISAPNEFDSSILLGIAFVFIFSYVFLSGLIVTFTPMMKSVCKSRINNGVIPRDYFSTLSICFKDDRITEQRHMGSSDLMYHSVFCVKQDLDNVYILLKGMSVIIIPNSAFIDEKQKQEIISFVESKIHRG